VYVVEQRLPLLSSPAPSTLWESVMRCEIRTLPYVALVLLLAACDFSLTASTTPNISSANGAVLPSGPAGSIVVIRGAGFGDAQGAGRLAFTPIGGGVPLAATIATWTQAVVVATVPGGAPGDYAVSVVQNNGLVSGALLFTVTAAVTFDPSVVAWSAGPNLPTAISGAGVAFAQIPGGGYVYAVGGAGAGGAPITTVSYAPVATNGTIGAWVATTALPAAIAFPAAVAATQRNSAVNANPNGFLYALGGASSAAGAPVATVYRAPINADGSIGSWTTTTALPAPVSSAAAIIQYGSLYVFGGAATGNVPVATAYRAPVQPAGNLNSWMPQASLPSGRARFGYGAFGLYLYAFGGDSIALSPNDTSGAAKRLAQVAYAKLNPSTGDIATAWMAAPTGLAEARGAFPAVLGAGNVLLTGGLYTGAASHTAEASYAALNADGTTGTFTAGGSSIFSACGCNLFNSGGTGYLAGDGTFHVLIVGGDDVNAPGTLRQETFVF
jgi:IPT/TIG domain